MPAKTRRIPLRSALLLALGLTLLVSCRPDPASRTPLAGGQNIEVISVPSVENVPAPSAEQITAAKSRIPYQYREKRPLGLRDYTTNLNPASNHSVPAN